MSHAPDDARTRGATRARADERSNLDDEPWARAGAIVQAARRRAPASIARAAWS
jgi:hypothetical protein